MSDKGRRFFSIVSVLEKETYFLHKQIRRKCFLRLIYFLLKLLSKHLKQDTVYQTFVESVLHGIVWVVCHISFKEIFFCKSFSISFDHEMKLQILVSHNKLILVKCKINIGNIKYRLLQKPLYKLFEEKLKVDKNHFHTGNYSLNYLIQS